MKMITEVLKMSDPEEIRREISKRHEMLRQLVGSMYPKIVSEEIIQLERRVVELEGGANA